ncbi:receptor-like protein kinase [Trifolium pratense]|uniref:Receptor-like protein kinase n=1 Tax=Trifolium pratense TaxID=57577 RepID=A0A2K3N1F9_TRIPR|nr:receptor-like protein kinase [Trifolium pratense]PNX98100.1 receptor-like protein kinase [Trifolium pratense]PNY13410.1 receptor-like protein kinase [Trifolium pratense]
MTQVSSCLTKVLGWLGYAAALKLLGRVFRPFGSHEAREISLCRCAQRISGNQEVRVVHHQSLNKRILVALIACASLLVGIFLFLLYFFFRRHKNLKSSASKSQGTIEAAKGEKETLSSVSAKLNYSRMADKKSSIAIFDFQLLETATNNFSTDNIMGESGSRIVYRACFDEHFQAAVKKADSDADREFENEVSLLSKIRHQNIIKLLGYCIHGESRFLVYEFMESGSLETQLHGPTRGSSLTWYIRLRIAIDVARALEYLHEHSNPPVVHRDLKSSNVLLDSNFNAKLSDFGLAVASGMQHKNMKMSGTLGYVAPEYISHGKLTDKSDVYAFGVVLLELLTGRKPMENMSSDQYQSLVSWAMPQLTDRSKLPSLLDPVIQNTMDLKHLYQVAAVAVLCVQAEPSYRPLITDVLHSLIPLVPLELGGSLRVTEPISSENCN